MFKEFKVREDGIYCIDKISYMSELIIPKDIFIEAYNKYINPTAGAYKEIAEWQRKLP